ncbi:MAG: EF-hand domain-containing protein [Siculibacillus sp.]|nr:EF-hand domain-containing protein [Siculibacillus sp.]
MINSIGSQGPAMNMWGLSRTSGSGPTQNEGPRGKSGEELFSKLDSDGSGGLSSSELQTFVDTLSSDTRGALLSAQEASTTTETTSTNSGEDLLAALDQDGDGAVSSDELESGMKPDRPPPGGPPPMGDPAEAVSDLFGDIDADGDGSISETELSDHVTAATASATSETSETSVSEDVASAFSAMDTDGDGTVSQSELDAHMKAQMPPGPPPPPPASSTETSSTTTVSTSTDSTTTTAVGTTSSETNVATETLVEQLRAAMAQFATRAYGRDLSSDVLSSLLGTGTSTVA